MLKHLKELRDFCYVWAMRQNGEAGAEQAYKFKLKAICVMYYIVLLELLAILHYKAGNPIPTPLILEENILAQLIFGLLLLTPYLLLFKYIFVKLSPFPIDKNMRPEKFKSLARKAALFYLTGMALMVLVPWFLDRLLPSLY